MNDTTQAPLQEWQDATIAIMCIEGRATRPGKVLGETGLGYVETSPYTPEYAPVHIQSGWYCGPLAFGDEEVCRQYLQELAPLLNWNQPRAQLLADPAYNIDRITEIFKKYQFEDAGATAGGGAW